MNNKVKNILVAVSSALVIAACATTQQAPTIMSVSVPEEGGIKFIKVTSKEDAVRSAEVTNNADGSISFVPRRFFDISKDGSLVAFMANKGDKVNIYLKDLTGGRAVVQRTFRDNVVDPAFSPDGKLLAFSDYRDGSWNIYTIGAESGSAVRQISISNQNEYYPVFSPDGKILVFVQNESQYYNGQYITRSYIWSYEMEKGILTQYVEGNLPVFTPDGKKLVFSRPSKDTGKYELWTFDFNTGQESIILTQKDKGLSLASVSPDGRRVAFVATSTGKNVPRNYDIFLVNIDGTNLTQLTFHPGHDLCPIWSPDGKSIYFLSQRGGEGGEYNIWRMDLR